LHTPRYWIERDCQFVYDEFIEHPKYLEGAGLYETNDNRRFTGWRDGQASYIPLEHSCETVLAKQTIRFMRNQGEPADRGNPEAPWFAWVSFSRPHSPLTPSEPFASMYSPDKITLPPSASSDVIASQPNRIRQVPRTNQAPLPGDVELMLSAYLGLVSQVDYGIGLILEELEKLEHLENTIIVFSADHGDYAGEHGLWSKWGGISSRAITRIPMIVHYPKSVVSGCVTNEIIESIDLFPTLCELVGLPIPDHIQGMSFMSLLENDLQPIRESALTENAYRKALATKEWRYVANTGDQPDELYDQLNDPWEVNNLIDEPQYTHVVQQLSRELLSRMAFARRPITLFDDANWQHDYDRDGRTPYPQSYRSSDTHI
jgi:arylsulfatase A-like enzyme